MGQDLIVEGSAISPSQFAGPPTVTQGAASYPWDSVQSAFFPFLSIDGTRWDKFFPYRLLVIDSANGNKVVGGSGGNPNGATNNQVATANIQSSSNGTNSIVSFTPIDGNWTFELPISPEQLNISDQFAINLEATLRGINEQHSGVRFKMINAAGSLGVWPYRSSVTNPPSSPNVLQSFFGGTISAATNLVNQATSTINTITTGHPASKPQRLGPETSPLGYGSTGYAIALGLEQFLEQYAEAKRDPANASWRLVFDIPKQNQSFVVTPLIFDWQQNAQKPLEVKYRLQLKAWRRINIAQSVPPTSPSISPISSGLLQTILNSLTQARTTAASALNLIGAVRSDVETPLQVLRQTTLLVKDLLGVVTAVADLPNQVISDYRSSITASLVTLHSSISSSITDPNAALALSSIVGVAKNQEGLSLDAVAGGQLGTVSAAANSINPALSVFSNPSANFTLLNQVPISSLSLTAPQQNNINNILATSGDVSIAQLKAYRSTIQTLALQLSNSFGSGNAFYNQVYGLQPPTSRIQPITLDEYAILQPFYDVMQGYDSLTATTELDDLQNQTNIEYVAGLADLSGIPFTTPIGKMLVPVPINLNIEQIAARYLGDPQQWLVIATMNNLKEPYIDENGFQIKLLSNATGRQITVASTVNMYLGQTVILMSATQLPTARKILDISTLSSTTYLLTLDGNANLDTYTTTDQAYLQVYLPGTVNSQQKIFVPSAIAAADTPSIIQPPSTTSDPLTALSKVDWLLTDDGDVAINNFGDFRLASGITNITQALKIKFGTQLGKWLTHPQFGLNTPPGISVSDVDVQNIYNSASSMIAQDPRFQGVSKLQIQLNGPVLTVSVAVQIAGISGIFPVTFQLTN